MNWQSLVGASALALCASGCATGARRDLTGVGPKGPTRAGYSAPRQVQEAVKPDQPDPFLPGATRPDRYRLTRYFPGLARPTAEKPAAEKPAAVAETTLLASKPPEAVPPASTSGRFAWLGLRKLRGPHTYLTDARSAAAPRGAAVPAVLPVALQLPRPTTDGAVTTTSAEGPADAPEADERPKAAAPANPDSSAANATPPPATEPQLAVPAIDPPAAAAPLLPEAKPETEVKPEAEARPEVATPDPKADPAPEAKPEAPPVAKPAAAAEPTAPVAADATPEKESRGRPRLPATPPTSYVEGKGSTGPDGSADERERPPAAVAAAKPAEGPADARAVKAAPRSAGDPGNSLGLPGAMLPASYSTHQSVAVRGSYQASVPGPVLASPQVEALPQSHPAVAAASDAKTWRRPCLRRLVRRVCKLGEFADPPTAKPH